MKTRRFVTLAIILLGLTGVLIWFTMASYSQIQAIEERTLYLDSLEWYVEPDEDLYFSYLDYGNENLICIMGEYDKKLEESVNTVGVITPKGEEIIACVYEDIVYLNVII